ncbi:MAG: hypothetical protein GY751_06605 [Bacteroidetes bacterium]|nr:hypothetical protein [Bacteroidota bacterium]
MEKIHEAIGSLSVLGGITRDTDVENPGNWNGVGMLVIPETAEQLGANLLGQFKSELNQALYELAIGRVAWTDDSTPLIALRRKQRAGFELANTPGDRIFAGYWKPDEYDTFLETARELLKTGNRHEADSIIRSSAKSDIRIWNQYLKGDVWKYEIQLVDRYGKVLDTDGVGGLYGESLAMEAVSQQVSEWKQKHHLRLAS